MKNLRIKTFALLIAVVTVVAASSVYAYYSSVPGIVQVYLRDPPAYSPDVQHIYITIYKVELHRVQGDGWFQVGGNFFQKVDLMSAINSSVLLSAQQIPQGGYNMVRLTLSYANVVLDQNGTVNTYLLSIPPDLQNGLKIPLQGTFTSKAGMTGSVLIDMTLNDADLHRSIMTTSILQAGLPN